MSFTLVCHDEWSSIAETSGPHSPMPTNRHLAPAAGQFYQASATVFPVPARVLRDAILAILDDPALVEVEAGDVVVSRTATGLTIASDSASVEILYANVAELVASCP